MPALLGTGGNKLWTGLFLDPEHGWKWSNGRPYRYMNWDSGRYFSLWFYSDKIKLQYPKMYRKIKSILDKIESSVLKTNEYSTNHISILFGHIKAETKSIIWHLKKR